jgi:hypothetical protein
MSGSSISLHLYFSLILVIGLVQIGKAQDIVNMPDITKRPTAQSVSLDIAPIIDGDVLQDEVWTNQMPDFPPLKKQKFM